MYDLRTLLAMLPLAGTYLLFWWAFSRGKYSPWPGHIHIAKGPGRGDDRPWERQRRSDLKALPFIGLFMALVVLVSMTAGASPTQDPGRTYLRGYVGVSSTVPSGAYIWDGASLSSRLFGSDADGTFTMKNMWACLDMSSHSGLYLTNYCGAGQGTLNRTTPTATTEFGHGQMFSLGDNVSVAAPDVTTSPFTMVVWFNASPASTAFVVGTDTWYMEYGPYVYNTSLMAIDTGFVSGGVAYGGITGAHEGQAGLLPADIGTWVSAGMSWDGMNLTTGIGGSEGNTNVTTWRITTTPLPIDAPFINYEAFACTIDLYFGGDPFNCGPGSVPGSEDTYAMSGVFDELVISLTYTNSTDMAWLLQPWSLASIGSPPPVPPVDTSLIGLVLTGAAIVGVIGVIVWMTIDEAQWWRRYLRR